MAIKFTEDQQKVIDTRDKNILVSAAAGSGKTAVLVERIIRRITDKEKPVDIDKMLVVTFTNAAAAGMKERISNAIQNKLVEEPDNAHLQRQAVLVHQAQITTIHSFCLYLIRNHFEAIELEPDFTVADEAAVSLLAKEVKDNILEEAFAAKDDKFLQMVEFICHNGRESVLEDYIDQLYSRAMSMPFPKSWLLERKKDYDYANLEEFTHTEGGKYLFLHIQGLIKSYLEAYNHLYKVAGLPDGPYMYMDTIEKERDFLLKILEQNSLDGMGQLLPNMEFGRLPSKKDDAVHAGIKEWVKDQRGIYKKSIQALGTQFFGKSPQSIGVENRACMQVADALIDITILYMERLATEKRKRGLIDFHDMEHMALEILLKETKNGYVPTEIALAYQEFFEEVMVDEYQDSNMVQEYLVTAVSGTQIGKNNRFMVGDVKQSIYKFRLARPEIFMEKYHSYALDTHDTSVNSKNKSYDTNVRIDLKQNFRSREEVLAATNSIFEKVMLPELGGIAYDKHAALYPGAQYMEAPDMGAELIIATEERPLHYTPKQWEAYCVAKRIKELMKTGSVLDETGKNLRPVRFSDIVLLFRTPSGYEEAYKSVFEQQGIPMYMTSGNGYFDAVEIQNLVKLLQVIENPRMDIPLFGVCTSIFGKMTEDQLAQVKVHYRNKLKTEDIKCKKAEQSLYDMLCIYQKDFPDSEAGQTISTLLNNLKKYRKQMHYFTVSELLYEILRDFKYREYVSVLPDGEKRLANVSLLLERAANFGVAGNQGVFAFTSYIKQLHKQAVDYGEAGIIERADVVRVMSIHKSKGLEFPITIVCGVGQAYQMRDKQQMILIDNDMGLGMEYINTNLRSKNKTLRKQVIALKMEQEILAEEQRILYVAMTRAKEKLIMVGYKANYQPDELMMNITSNGTCMLSDVLSARSYLDLCLLAHTPNSPISIMVMTCEDYISNEVCETVSIEERKTLLLEKLNDKETIYTEQDPLYQAYKERFEYQYPFNNLRELYTKTSVSELKKAAIKEENEAVYDAFEQVNDQDLIPYIPAFMQGKAEMKGAERGTAYHRVMELLDFTNIPTSYVKWEETLDAMVQTGKLSDRQKECIYVKKLQDFISSGIGKRMQTAAEKDVLHKEQSFFLGVPANLVNPEFPPEEMMLVQGIIDAYFEEDGELVLMDYKTDRVESSAELISRYKVQMEYYTKALEQALGKHVKEVILYSLSLNEEVIV